MERKSVRKFDLQVFATTYDSSGLANVCISLFSVTGSLPFTFRFNGTETANFDPSTSGTETFSNVHVHVIYIDVTIACD